jgi:lipid-binding SYLF domain-containing protein
MRTFNRSTAMIIAVVSLFWAAQSVAISFGKKDPEELRAEVLEIRTEVLNRLFAEEPQTKEMINRAVGYAAFSNHGFNFGVVSSANGKGLAHDNGANKDIYMHMYSLGTGFGLGIKKFSAVFIFHSRQAFDQFVTEGWDFSGQADVAATTDKEDGGQPGALDESIALMDGVSVYQLTEKGLALQATLQGTKYWKNKDLN